MLDRASPYFYRAEDARCFIKDFMNARDKLAHNQPRQPAKQQKEPSQSQQQQQQQKEQNQAQTKSKAKKKPIPVSAHSLFKLVGPPPPAPQLDE